jgi:inner membrane protein
MDNVTHALAGVLLADATVAAIEPRDGPAATGVRRTAVWLGVVAAELPDLDIAWSGALLGDPKLGYLLHHRGHTHTVLFAVAAALALWGLALAWRRRRAGAAPFPSRGEGAALLALALAGTLSHVLLDWTNSYGVHPWWPWENAWRYGDAVFIVEPWLWVAAIPPLLAGPRRTAGRVLLGFSLVAILAAAWALPVVTRGVSVALTAAALAWLAACAALRSAPAAVRAALGLAAWLAVEGVGLASSREARAAVRRAVQEAHGPDAAGLAAADRADASTFTGAFTGAFAGARTAARTAVDDIVLTQSPADPRCVEALVVERDGPTYRVTTATVAPWPGWRAAADCPSDIRAVRGEADDGPEVLGDLGGGLRRSARRSTPGVRWRREWSAPLDSLRTLAATHCQVAAALRFMRVPVWDRRADGAVRLSDLRYGFGGNGFADLFLPAVPAACPGRVPPWVPPRARLLDAASDAGAAVADARGAVRAGR